MIKQKTIITSLNQGFSLIEMAMVLLILSILLSGLTVSLSQSATNARRTETKNQLKVIQEALYGYAQAKGHLPCPADANSDGVEAKTANSCDQKYGFVPIRTLGINGSVDENNLLLDSWQNPIRYSVTDAGSDAFTTGITEINSLITTTPLPTMFRVCDIDDCSGPILTDTAPVVLVSMGENWLTFTSDDEVENAGGVTIDGYRVSNTNDFVSTDYSEDNFDDLILWLSPYTLYSRMIKAGQLP